MLSAGLSSCDGEVGFIANNNLEMGSISSTVAEDQGPRVQTVSLKTLLEKNNWGKIDLLKLDIEGQEFDVIAKAPINILRKLGQITVEFHDFLPAYKDGNLYPSAVQRLRKAGFVCLPMSFRMHSDILFINTRFPGLQCAPICRMAFLGKWALKCQELLRG